MKTSFYVCKKCHSEFEFLDDDKFPVQCLECDSKQVKERKNAKLNCRICCKDCPEKEECLSWKDE